ncbi:hypothetical protein GCM10018965_003850 [Nonomuraea roseola]
MVVDGHLGNRGERPRALQRDLGPRAQVHDVPDLVRADQEVDVGRGQALQVVGSEDAAVPRGSSVGCGQSAQVTNVDSTLKINPSHEIEPICRDKSVRIRVS